MIDRVKRTLSVEKERAIKCLVGLYTHECEFKKLVEAFPRQVASVEDYVLEDTLPLEDALEDIRDVRDFFLERGKTIFLVGPLGTGKTHDMALMRELIERITRGEKEEIERRFSKRISLISKRKDKAVEEAKDFLEETLSRLIELREIPSGEAEIVVIRGRDLEKDKPIYNIIFEKLGLPEVDEKAVESAVKRLEKYPRKLAIFVEEVNKKYYNLKRLSYDRSFYKEIGRARNVLFVVDANYDPSNEEFNEMLKRLKEGASRYTPYREKKTQVNRLRQIALLAGLEGEPRSVNYIKDPTSLEELGRVFLEYGENVLRNFFRYGLVRQALYEISELYSKGITFFSGLVPVELIMELPYNPRTSEITGVKTSRIETVLHILRSLLKPKIKSEDTELRAKALLKALVIKDGIPRYRIKLRFSNIEPLNVFLDAGIVKIERDRVYLDIYFIELLDRDLRNVLTNSGLEKISRALEIASRYKEVPTEPEEIKETIKSAARKAVASVDTKYGKIPIAITSSPKDLTHVSIEIDEGLIEELENRIDSKISELAKEYRKEGSIPVEVYQKAFYEVREKFLKEIPKYTKVVLPKEKKSVREFKKEISEKISGVYDSLLKRVRKNKGSNDTYVISDVRKELKIEDRVPDGIIEKILEKIAQNKKYVRVYGGSIEFLSEEEDEEKKARKVVKSVLRRPTVKKLSEALKKCEEEGIKEKCLEILSKELEGFVVIDKEIIPARDAIEEILEKKGRIFKSHDEALERIVKNILKSLYPSVKKKLEESHILYIKEIKEMAEEAAQGYSSEVVDKLLEEIERKLLSEGINKAEGEEGEYFYTAEYIREENLGISRKHILAVFEGRPEDLAAFLKKLEANAKSLAKKYGVDVVKWERKDGF